MNSDRSPYYMFSTRIIMALSYHDTRSMAELARDLNCSISNALRYSLSFLHDENVIILGKADEKKQRSIISLTDKGHRLYPLVRAISDGYPYMLPGFVHSEDQIGDVVKCLVSLHFSGRVPIEFRYAFQIRTMLLDWGLVQVMEDGAIRTTDKGKRLLSLLAQCYEVDDKFGFGLSKTQAGYLVPLSSNCSDSSGEIDGSDGGESSPIELEKINRGATELRIIRTLPKAVDYIHSMDPQHPIAYKTLLDEVKKGKIPSKRIGTRYTVCVQDVLDYYDTCYISQQEGSE